MLLGHHKASQTPQTLGLAFSSEHLLAHIEKLTDSILSSVLTSAPRSQALKS